MEPYRYLEKVSASLDGLQDSEKISTILDELEFLYDTLDPEFQELASDLISRLTTRLKDITPE